MSSDDKGVSIKEANESSERGHCRECEPWPSSAGNLCLFSCSLAVGLNVLGAIGGSSLVGGLTTVLEVFVVYGHGFVNLGAKSAVVRGTSMVLALSVSEDSTQLTVKAARHCPSPRACQ